VLASSQLPVLCRRAVRCQAGAPVAGAPVRALARTYELDAGGRWPMIACEESLPGCGLPWAGFAGFPGSVRESGGVVSHPPMARVISDQEATAPITRNHLGSTARREG
jgi:hypothetical protein